MAKGPIVLTAEELIKKGYKETPMLISPILERAAVGCLYGGSDTGKSYLGLFLATAICSDEPQVIGLPITRRHGRAIIVSTEDSEQSYSVRLSKLEKVFSGDKLRIMFEVENLAQELELELQKCPVDFVFIDTLGDLLKGNINDSLMIRRFLLPFKRMAEKHQTMILFNHHVSKAKESGVPNKNHVLGSEAIQSASRLLLHLAKNADSTRTLTITKANNIPDSEKDKPLRLIFDPVKGYTRKENNTNRTEGIVKVVMREHQKGKSLREIATTLSSAGLKIGKTKVGEIVANYAKTAKLPSSAPTPVKIRILEMLRGNLPGIFSVRPSSAI